MKKRENFTSRAGFVLSCIGAAVGLGNIWMFPYRLGQNGGSVFLIPYFIFVLILGSTGLITEFAFGRAAQGGSLTGIKNSFRNKGLKGGVLVGAIPAIGLAGVFMFYNVVVGWIIKYFTLSIDGRINKIDISSFFDGFSGSPETIFWNLLAIGIALGIVCMGVTKGIEKINKIIMPLLFVIFVILAIRSLTLPGAMEGVKYLLTPQWEYLFKINTWVMALGQAFFTVSLNGCGMVVYGSYMKKDMDIPRSAISTAIFDTISALLASFVIMPAVFAFGLDPAAGPPLLFITVPTIFKSMAGGQLLGILFFLSVIFAAISSSINMLEGPVEALMSQSKMCREKAAIFIAMTAFVLSIPLNINMGLFNNFADLMTVILSPVGALIVFISFYYLNNKDSVLEEINSGATTCLGNKFIAFAKYGFTIITILVIVLGIIYGGIG
ncbi:sodium-dependent transporter [Clostridium chauvoei]|uniref:Sodium-dependent transporter n=2 Tax=Clostridium chauvoei TaxID=46867 RepID=A0ABD4RK22_9CLOT|nr:sodium-dependent transporter [Clostridium chauvoei]ATD53777.1 sodium-dependent transporter [Clostridium chauvoei]ATD56297.1 sodium-dependent transporter [Clostridium chauvoei]MBX7281471.1 sodium-dependent transporter [Clostridium chauvoei]MBX7283971.1 sodium-dependent transporter [Clostridium chauvoei]MBX7286519.1 sodium-dependent transporter [Clostridium chauvoei]